MRERWREEWGLLNYEREGGRSYMVGNLYSLVEVSRQTFTAKWYHAFSKNIENSNMVTHSLTHSLFTGYILITHLLLAMNK